MLSSCRHDPNCRNLHLASCIIMNHEMLGTGFETHTTSQLITGALGGLGVLLARWLAQNDMSINLLDIQHYHTFPLMMQRVHSQSSLLTIMRGDIATAENASFAIQGMQTPMFGIFHAAGILHVSDHPPATECLYV